MFELWSHLLLVFIFRYGDLYTEKNVAISGIHTHAGPGGYLQYIIYIVTSLGFVRQSFDVLVNGIENSIVQAHENLRPGSIFINKGKELNSYQKLNSYSWHFISGRAAFSSLSSMVIFLLQGYIMT